MPEDLEDEPEKVENIRKIKLIAKIMNSRAATLATDRSKEVEEEGTSWSEKGTDP